MISLLKCVFQKGGFLAFLDVVVGKSNTNTVLYIDQQVFVFLQIVHMSYSSCSSISNRTRLCSVHALIKMHSIPMHILFLFTISIALVDTEVTHLLDKICRVEV